MRPVRLAPCAAGASPTTTTDACGSPKPGTGRPQYSSSRNAARFSAATCSRHATSRGQARQATISRSSRASESIPAGYGYLGTAVRCPRSTKPKPPPGHHDPAGAPRPDAVHRGDAARSAPPGCTWPTPGGAQADAAAARIAELDKVGAVYASPLERTRETAAPIARALGLRVRVDRGLLECDFGEWTGAALKELARKLPEWRTVQRYPSGFRFPGGESFAEMQTRIASALARLVAAPSRRDDRGRVPRRPDQGRAWPAPSAPTSTCSSASSCRRARSASSPTPPAVRSCSPSTRPATTSPRWDCREHVVRLRRA